MPNPLILRNGEVTRLPGPPFCSRPKTQGVADLAIPTRTCQKAHSPTPEESGNYYVKLELFAPDKSGESKLLDVEKSETTQFRAFKFELG